jgi:hypothetical protein
MTRPPQPDESPTDGEDTAFHGTNPWSGPYLVLAIGGVFLVAVGEIAIAAFILAR